MNLNGVVALILRYSPHSIALRADYASYYAVITPTVVECRSIMSAKYRLPVTFGQNWPTQQSHGHFARAKLLVKHLFLLVYWLTFNSSNKLPRAFSLLFDRALFKLVRTAALQHQLRGIWPWKAFAELLIFLTDTELLWPQVTNNSDFLIVNICHVRPFPIDFTIILFLFFQFSLLLHFYRS